MSVIACDSPCKDGNSRFTTVPLLIKYKLDIIFSPRKIGLVAIRSCFCRLDFYKVWLHFWRQNLYAEKKHFPSQKNDGFFQISLSLQGYRYKSGIAIFAWRVTWNCAYSPFKGIFRIFPNNRIDPDPNWKRTNLNSK